MSKAWFRPKRYGYGAGLPISWEGWAMLAGFIAGTWAVGHYTPILVGASAVRGWSLASFAVLLVAFIWIARAKTEGGWRWRSGRDV